ncbi:MAG TPA: HEAT repeat domain-containing protein [Acidimicrobiales bacterium]
MPTNDSTLPPDLEERLLRAGFLAEGDVSFIIDSLHADLPRQRVLALRAANRRGLLTHEYWLRALKDPAVDVRREALAALAYVENVERELLVVVRAMLEDRDALVVDGAIFTLGEHLDVDAVARLAEIAHDHADARCRESAVAALGAIGDDRGRAAVLAALDDKPPVRRRAIVALSNFEGPDVDAALAMAAQDRDWQVRAAVDQLNKEPD